MSERYKILFNYGSIGGGAAFLWAVFMYYLGFSPFGIGMFTAFWIPILTLFLSIRANSKIANGEFGYPFSRAFFDGITTAILAGLLKGMLLFVFMKVLAPDLAEQYYSEQYKLIDFLQEKSAGQNLDAVEQMKLALEEDKKIGFGGYRVVAGEINKYFYSAIPFSIIVALIFKKPIQKNNVENG